MQSTAESGLEGNHNVGDEERNTMGEGANMLGRFEVDRQDPTTLSWG
jgi:hypothetical protein